ncbi:MAG: quinone oxidoreductase [Gammaproteobacteria bacterium]|nr:quinone oxidoreductase [Gammaproteobacteria bacterium]
MKAVVIHQTGGPEVLQYQALLPPEPGPTDLIVRNQAIGVNYIDTYQRSGQYPLALPIVIGLEAAGEVIAVGEDVKAFTTGDRVAYGNHIGAYAEETRVPEDKAIPLPNGLEPRLAAAALLQGMTAHYLVNSTYPLTAGQVCLVHAAAGGVGLLLTQMASRIGARVIATVSTNEKAELARRAGADEVILYNETDFAAATLDLTGGAGVNVVYDSVGKTTFEGSLQVLQPRGYLVLFGQSSGPVGPIDPLRLSEKSLFLTRPSLFNYVDTREQLLWRAGAVFEAIQHQQLQLRIERTLKLKEAAQAHRLLQSRTTTGKLLLIP